MICVPMTMALAPKPGSKSTATTNWISRFSHDTEANFPRFLARLLSSQRLMSEDRDVHVVPMRCPVLIWKTIASRHHQVFKALQSLLSCFLCITQYPKAVSSSDIQWMVPRGVLRQLRWRKTRKCATTFQNPFSQVIAKLGILCVTP